MRDSFSAYDQIAPVLRALSELESAESAPSLEQLAARAALSPGHFQRVFKEAVGISPKKYQLYLASGRAKRALINGESVLGASLSAGLSGPSRLHDLMLNHDAVTPGAYRRRGAGVRIRYACLASPFGRVCIGACERGICWLGFVTSTDADALAELHGDWPSAILEEDAAFVAPMAARAFDFARDRPLDAPLGLYVQGSDFQIKVWEALLKIPPGGWVSYGALANAIEQPKAARAVGSAVGANLISILIPCHRVLRANGAIHNYRWGTANKHLLLAGEQARNELEEA